MGRRLIPPAPFKWRVNVRRFIRREHKKPGLPPGTLVHVGDKKVERTRVTLLDYDEAHIREEEVSAVDACAAVKDHPTVTWVNVDGLHEVETIRKIGECFGLHPLVLEDILHTEQRPKIEGHDDKLFIIVKGLRYDNDLRQVVSEQVSLVLGPTFVLSFQEGESDLFDAVRERIRSSVGRIRSSGPDYLAYALLDVMVDCYFLALEAMQDQIEALESELVTDPAPLTLRAIQDLRTDTLLVRKAIWPLREVAARLARGDAAAIREPTLLYLRDLYDHTVQAIDVVESFRDVVAGMLDIYLSSVSNRMNAIMKVLTLAATIFLPLTLIAGIYGMNFRYMPELHLRYGYYGVWIAMVMVAAGMLLYFRVKRWL